ncbi:hypothetical protein ACHAPU_001882 [Fusarium lateritium]
MLSKLILLALPLVTLAAPTVKRNDGDITFYHPGLGACGKDSGDSSMVAAIAASLYDAQDLCNKVITLKGDKGTVKVTVVDRCESCGENDLDISPAAFMWAIGPLETGRGKGTWSFD